MTVSLLWVTACSDDGGEVGATGGNAGTSGGSAGTGGKGGASSAGSAGAMNGKGGSDGSGGSSGGRSGSGGVGGSSGAGNGGEGGADCEMPLRARAVDTQAWCYDSAGDREIVACSEEATCPEDAVCVRRQSDGAVFLGYGSRCFANLDGWELCSVSDNDRLTSCGSGGQAGSGGQGGDSG